MLVHEDRELEEAAMSGDFDVIVPVDIFVPDDGGEAVITAYRNVWEICEKYENEHGESILDGDSLNTLCSQVMPIIRDMGYDVDRKGSRVVLEYRIDSVNNAIGEYAKGAVIIGSSHEIDGLECPLLHKPCLDEFDEDDVCALVIKGGVICAAAGVNDYSDDDSLEIYVETAKECRRKGYGTAAVAQLCRYLTERGYIAAYNCAESNKGSAGIAQKLGMTLKGRRFSMICYAGEITEKGLQNGI